MVRRFKDPVQVKVQVKVQVAAQPTVLSEVQSGAHVVAATGPAVGPAVVTGEVARKSAEPPSDAVPAEFIWRGRLYVVRDVLAHWRERRAWWRDALDAEEQDVRPGQTLAAAAREQHIWRVEASPGWSFAPGVYDLAHDESAGRDPSDRWSLVRVAD